MKILVSAYACRPKMGSEPGVGWNMVQELAQKCGNVWVITRRDNQQSIEAEISKISVLGMNFVYHDLPAWARWWNRGQTALYFHYYFWQIGAYFLARKLHQENNFDLVHHVTYGRYCFPSFLSLLPIPFVWGPLGGGEAAPKSFWRDFHWSGKVYESLRDWSRWIGERDPFVKMTAKKSAVAIVCTSETADCVSALGAKRIERVLGQTGVNRQDIAQLEQYAVSHYQAPIRFISMGRLLHWKGFHLGLNAFAAANLEHGEYWIVGDGPERNRLEALAKELGISERVRFVGSIPREQALRILGESCALIHPSLHDFSPTVCIEAMAASRPVICLNLGGPAFQITEETGFRIASNTPEGAVQGLAEAIIRLAQDPELRIKMGQAGQKRVSELYRWDIKAKSLVQLYEDILACQQSSASPSVIHT
ncbi:glycosyltransferase family 4 protein [Fortiea sp. LEGE XX443]|uniref:glycosyltransferase family 4 protein n=1 Tax=Fortiea sp. LEGE XX443 TaxID=1828611 RepID=UPI00187F97F9|nr:glycosyltransferase family 4 protein [Fortiea sp. LEGE XX443]MBE9004347.1 glycosyltransferase family 4 protein [Fortiea sp. LEGE XX443]